LDEGLEVDGHFPFLWVLDQALIVHHVAHVKLLAEVIEDHFGWVL
jgi:hypothetical protein